MPSSAQSRRDPQKGKKGFSRTKGFTVIEMMIVVAVVAILASLALPSYRTIIEKRQVTSGAEQFGSFISSVQFESVKLGQELTLVYDLNNAGQANTDWCLGVTSNASCDCSLDPASYDSDNPGNYCVIEIDGVAEQRVRAVRQTDVNYPMAVSAMIGDNSFTFDPVRGLLTDPRETAEFEFLSDNDTYALNVQVLGTGRIKLCSKSSDKKVPGYDQCQ